MWYPLPFLARHPRRALHHARTTHRSGLADKWLAGLEGIEIGGAAHNDFGLARLNVDRYGEPDTVFKREEIERCGRALDVDIVAPAHALPFGDGAWDFVLASHVIEHVPDPIRALEEWRRVARARLFLVVPHRDRTFDSDRPLTPLAELVERHARGLDSSEDRHWTVWNLETFLELCDHLTLPVLETRDPDDKTGNGFAVVLDSREV